jgi:hypothetical protein
LRGGARRALYNSLLEAMNEMMDSGLDSEAAAVAALAESASAVGFALSAGGKRPMSPEEFDLLVDGFATGLRAFLDTLARGRRCASY